VKVACADYLGIALSSSSTSTDDAMSGDVGVTSKVFVPLLKRLFVCRENVFNVVSPKYYATR
jgi:hypothetical protein